MTDQILEGRIGRIAVCGLASKGADGVIRDVLKRCDDLKEQASLAARRADRVGRSDPNLAAVYLKVARELAFEHAKLSNAKELLLAGDAGRAT